jgi:hypothetical protein
MERNSSPMFSTISLFPSPSATMSDITTVTSTVHTNIGHCVNFFVMCWLKL